MPTVNAVTGARTRFTIDGVVVALGIAVNVQHGVTWEPVKVLNNIKTLGHEPTDYTASLTASMVKAIGQTATALNLMAKRGASPEEFLQNLLTQNEVVAQFEDRKNPEKIIGRLTGVLLSTESFGIDRNAGIATSNLDFVAIDYKDESEVIV
jgi:hypothetical protein